MMRMLLLLFSCWYARLHHDWKSCVTALRRYCVSACGWKAKIAIRVLVYEYVCGGGLAIQPLPESLAREGWAMLASIVDDLACVEGVHVTVLLDERMQHRTIAA